MKNIKFNYYDLKNNKVLVEVSYINRDFFNKGYYSVFKHNNIEYEVETLLYKPRGIINLIFDEYSGKIVKLELSLGDNETYAVIPKKYVYIFEDLEEKVYNVEEKKLFDILNIKKGNLYYYICHDNFYKNFFIREDYNYDGIDDYGSEMTGNVFKTKESAEEFVKELEKLFIERKQKLLEVG